jgi:hypothetical protein
MIQYLLLLLGILILAVYKPRTSYPPVRYDYKPFIPIPSMPPKPIPSPSPSPTPTPTPPPPPPIPPPSPPPGAPEVHLYLSKLELYEDPSDSISAKITWRNLPPPVGDWYSMYVLERDSRVLVAGTDVHRTWINPSEGSLDFNIGYLMMFGGQWYLPPPGNWVADVKTSLGDILSPEIYPVKIYDKYTLNDIASVTYDMNTDTVTVSFNKPLTNALLLWRFTTYDAYGNIVRDSGLHPYWSPLWFSGSTVSINLPGDPSFKETTLVFSVQKRGVRDYVISIERPPIPITLSITSPSGVTVNLWVFQDRVVKRSGWIYWFPDTATTPFSKDMDIPGYVEYISIGISPPGSYHVVLKRRDTGATVEADVTFTGDPDEESYKIVIPR